MDNNNSSEASLLPVIEDKGTFTLKFETETHSADIEIVANALLNLDETIKAFAKEFPEIESSRLDVTAIQQGSVDVALAFRFLKRVVTASIVPKITNLLTELIKLYRFLKGSEPKKVENAGEEKSMVTNSFGEHATFNNSVINVFNFNSPPFGDLSGKSDSNVESISILNGNGQIEEKISKDEYERFRKRRKTLPDSEEKTEEVERTLVIATIPILSPRKTPWGFEQDGLKFSAVVEDESFLSSIQDRTIAFHQGDSVRVLMSLVQRFDPYQGQFVVAKRRILKVLSPPTQMALGLFG